jgi:hypothetical protein
MFDAIAAADLCTSNLAAFDSLVRPHLSDMEVAEVEWVLADRARDAARAALSRAFVDGTEDSVVDGVAEILPVLAATLADHAKSRENAVGRMTQTVRLVLADGSSLKVIRTAAE